MATQPNIPTLKDSQKPQVKLRGLEAGMTLFDRMKQFKKKDLAFILAGLGTLFMAPLAEHFMMSPESGEGRLQQGWKGSAGGRGIFDGSGNSPYEPGTTGLAPGGAIGGGSDIITPLNVRDPSALVMGPGATQQPPTNSAMPGTPPPTAPGRSDSDLKDALSASARGVGAAAKKALLPLPKIALGGSGLRGLGAVGGGGSSASAGGPISSSGLVSGKAAGGGGGLNNVRAAPGFKGVARGQSSGDTGGMDALKKAAGDAANAFNRGSANSGLNEAANTAIPSGGGSFGGNGAGGMGSTDKPFGGNQGKDAKSVGESLAFLKQKAMQEADIARWAKEKEAWDFNLKAGQILGKGAETFADTLVKSAADKVAACLLKGAKSKDCTEGEGGVTSYSCLITVIDAKEAGAQSKEHDEIKIIDAGDVGDAPKDCNDSQKNGTSTAGKTYYVDGNKLTPCQGHNGLSGLHGCMANDLSAMKKLDAKTGGAVYHDQNLPPPAGSAGDASSKPATSLEANCKILSDMRQNLTTDAQRQIGAFLAAAADIVAVRDAMEPSTGSGANAVKNGCDDAVRPIVLIGENSLIKQLQNIASGVLENSEKGGLLDMMDQVISNADRANPLLARIRDGVDEKKPGVVKQTVDFSASVGLVKTKLDGAGLAKTPFAVDKSWFNSDASKAKYRDVDSAVAQIAVAAQGVNEGAALVQKEFDNLSSAAHVLDDEKKILQDAAKPTDANLDGPFGTVMEVVRRNGDMDCVGGALTCVGMKPPFAEIPQPPLTKPNSADFDQGKDSADIAQLKKSLTDANETLYAAKAKVRALNDEMKKTPGDPGCAIPSSPCRAYIQPAQAALAKAVESVKKIRAEQRAVDKSIREKVQAAAKPLNLGL